MQKVVFFYLCVYIKYLNNFVELFIFVYIYQIPGQLCCNYSFETRDSCMNIFVFIFVYFRRLFGTIFSVIIDLFDDT